MATTVSTPLRSTTRLPWLGISPLRWGTPPTQVPWASSGYQRACPSPTSTPLWEQVPTVCMTTANASCWAWAAAPSSCASGSSSAAHSATPALLSTRSVTAASAATVSQTATCSSTKTARHQPPPPPTIPSPPRRTQTSPGRSRSACRPMSDHQGWRVLQRVVPSSQDCKTVTESALLGAPKVTVTVSSGRLEMQGLVGFNTLCNLFRLLNVPKSGSRSLIFPSCLTDQPPPFLTHNQNCATERLFANTERTQVWNLNMQCLVSAVGLLAEGRNTTKALCDNQLPWQRPFLPFEDCHS